ncbi:hypothetical protein [Marinifilum flexuosum]|uniref:hypothetical protein n=1 Tax=Marinifilum flexuosum TaxID=1117708 RepID=UPI002494E65B|nr:hypothetical protein [Marinifilum flexuosum]
MERAENFTNKYLSIIEETLHVENVNEGKPIFLPGRINQFTIINLASKLNDLVRSTELSNSITDIESASRMKENTFTTGVGYSEDFLNFVKLGLLIGDKVVLWDSVLPGILNNPNGVDLNYLGNYVFNILSLKKLARKGGLIFLPHPSFWNDRTQYYFKALSTINNVPNELIGFVNAWSLLQDGFHLNPYLMATSDSNTYRLHQQFLKNEKLYPKEKLNNHNDLYELIRYNKFNFLADSKIEDFYDILNKDINRHFNVKNDLYKYIDLPKHLTETERKGYLDKVFTDLFDGIKKQNDSIEKSKLAKPGLIAGGISTVGSLVAATLSPGSTASIISLFSGVLGASGALYSLYGSLVQKPVVPVLYQVFNELNNKVEVDQADKVKQDEYKRKYNLE